MYLPTYLGQKEELSIHESYSMLSLARGNNLKFSSLPFCVFCFDKAFCMIWFVRPHLDYGGTIYDQPNNEIFTQKTERIQRNVALVITAAI